MLHMGINDIKPEEFTEEDWKENGFSNVQNILKDTSQQIQVKNHETYYNSVLLMEAELLYLYDAMSNPDHRIISQRNEEIKRINLRIYHPKYYDSQDINYKMIFRTPQNRWFTIIGESAMDIAETLYKTNTVPLDLKLYSNLEPLTEYLHTIINLNRLAEGEVEQ